MSKAPHILLVEDEPDLLALYQELLVGKGYHVTPAKGGLLALQLLRQNNYDLVLLDVMLPDLDGLRIIELLKAPSPMRPPSPIVLLTNLLPDNLNTRGKKNNIKGYLVKSNLTPEQFLHEIQKFLNTEP